MADRYFPATWEIVEILFDELRPLAELTGYQRTRAMDDALELIDKWLKDAPDAPDDDY